ncbi:uncharacterized protein CIMG_03102 [Coccidioides immitis RS]|uniref:Uncharacterized protein n=1 Tax=Coccidioides immitis (strain RS) TaxID=246410 RepID=A0A0E1RY13_COCIM|nr:uncharacterized protein CIMG_03102 [Coccidioides immitis RS]EAS32078.2 hypothetical protein CIMG_03102 [Coccidioides immitis RS]TPX19259.1 hypothetical protein DIZ76_017047 [Coccidioides immitis]
MQFGVLLFFASVTLAVARVEAVPGADTGTSLQMRAPQCVELYQDCLDNPNCCPPNRCRNWTKDDVRAVMNYKEPEHNRICISGVGDCWCWAVGRDMDFAMARKIDRIRARDKNIDPYYPGPIQSTGIFKGLVQYTQSRQRSSVLEINEIAE